MNTPRCIRYRFGYIVCVTYKMYSRANHLIWSVCMVVVTWKSGTWKGNAVAGTMCCYITTIAEDGQAYPMLEIDRPKLVGACEANFAIRHKMLNGPRKIHVFHRIYRDHRCWCWYWCYVFFYWSFVYSLELTDAVNCCLFLSHYTSSLTGSVHMQRNSWISN